MIINHIPKLTQTNVSTKFKKPISSVSNIQTSNKLFAYQDYIHFGSKNINELYDEYNWYVNHDHTPEIEAFLKIEDDKKTMDGFLTSILNNDEGSYRFIDSIARNPRKSSRYFKELENRVGSNSDNLMTFYYDSPYNKAYNKYLEQKYERSHTLCELLKIRPDWKGSALIEKHNKLKNNDYLEIGKVPNCFPNGHLFQIADYLNNFKEIGLKQKKDIQPLKLDNRTYEFKFFTEGRSDKNVFGVFTPERKKYVLKMGEPEKRSLDEPFALGTLAKIDNYLTTNRSRNSAPICYYNHARNMSLYKYIEHTPTKGDSRDLSTIKKKLPDFKDLGLTYNDNVGNKNCFLLNHNSNDDIKGCVGFDEGVAKEEWISVDNDHVTFSNILQPSNYKYNSPLPNAMQMFF